MKKIFAVIVLLMLVVMTTVAIAGQANIFNRQNGGVSGLTSLFSGPTGTTAATSTNYAIFDYPVNHMACDIITSPVASAQVLTFTLYSNVTGTTLLDTTNNTIYSSTTITPSTTANVMRSFTKSDFPFRFLQGTITTLNSGTTMSINVNCAAMQ